MNKGVETTSMFSVVGDSCNFYGKRVNSPYREKRESEAKCVLLDLFKTLTPTALALGPCGTTVHSITWLLYEIPAKLCQCGASRGGPQGAGKCVIF